MIRQLIKITAVATAALVAIGCAAKEFTEPGDVAKTGFGGTSNVLYDVTQTSIFNYTAPTSPILCPGGNGLTGSGGTTPIVVPAIVSGNSFEIRVPQRAANTTNNAYCSEVGQLVLAGNPNDSVNSVTITGTIVISDEDPTQNGVMFTRLFSNADIDRDGENDTVGYRVIFASSARAQAITGTAAGMVIVNRVGLLTAAVNSSGTATAVIANPQTAVLNTTGSYPFSVTIKQLSTGIGSVRVELNGNVILDGTTGVSVDDGATTIGTGTAGADNTTRINPLPTTLWGIVNQLPVTGIGVTLYGRDSAMDSSGNNGPSFPKIRNLKVTR